MDVPSRDEAVRTAELLVAGRLSPLEAAQWAEKFSYPENEKIYLAIDRDDQPLRQLIDDLSLAAAISETGRPIYAVEDFRHWLDEFRQSVQDF